MLGNKKGYETVIEAQERHIKRLERMIESLFNSLMFATKGPTSMSLQEEPTIISPAGEVEPNPGELFSPEDIGMKP